MKKKRFTVLYSRVEPSGVWHKVGSFSIRAQAEKTLQILAESPSFLGGTIIEEYLESI